MKFLPTVLFLGFVLSCGGVSSAAQNAHLSRLSSLVGDKPDGTILRVDIDGDGKPDVLERWWNGKRVRWLDENHDLKSDDTLGDLNGDMLQVDIDGDGSYDGFGDMNIKWIDRDHDGVADVQTIAINPTRWPSLQRGDMGDPHWMLFINHDSRGVLGWTDWAKFDFACWAYSGSGDWLPNYHDGDFLKVHMPPGALQDARLSWENPFSFSISMAMVSPRWRCAGSCRASWNPISR